MARARSDRAGGARAPEPMLEIIAPRSLPWQSFAKSDGQYGSTVTPAAASIDAIFSDVISTPSSCSARAA